MKVKVAGDARMAKFLLGPVGKTLAFVFVIAVLGGLGVFTYYYNHYSRLIDEKLRRGPFANTAKLYAAPKIVSVGDPLAPEDVMSDLRRAGYSESRGNPMGHYRARPDGIEVYPGPDSYFDQEAGLIRFKDGRVARITSLQDNTERPQYQLEPQLVTNLSDRNREKRRLIAYTDMPPVLIQAVTSVEDKRFFQHAGFDPIRIVKAVIVDIKEGRKEEGASTISQQLARGLWLYPDKTIKRKLAEMVIAMQLEQKLSKEEILETYCNNVYLGRRGSFAVHGFGEASNVYFDKDVRQLTLTEAATLAGIIQRPSYFNPFRNPDRVRERRNVVLSLMRANGYITDRQYAVATESPLGVVRGANQSPDAPYFVDLVNDFLTNRFQDHDFQSSSYRIYTTLDMDLQRAAGEAVRIGVQQVDELLKKQKRHRNTTFPDAQVALVALDARTGHVKALVGGRNYGVSQLNHAVAKRQPGSIFKPFVYAAALESGLEGAQQVVTPSSTVLDAPTTFWFDGKPYEPGNFGGDFYGQVTLRRALAKSMNIATVKVAESAGYEHVVELARRAGLNYQIKPTPAVALGAYEATPLEMAGAYTVFANGGTLVRPSLVNLVRTQKGDVLFSNKLERRKALDSRVAFLMTNMLEEVMRSGTAAGARSRGFTVPAAGKTGTSHDGWFAGYTTELICVVWVGFDDNRDLGLEGAKSALPIWTEFMKRALEYRPYRNVKPFTEPDGVVAVQVDPLSGMPATPACPSTYAEVFIAGTQPVGACPLHGGAGGVVQHVAGWETPPAPDAPPAAADRATQNRRPAIVVQTPVPAETSRPEAPKEEKKKGFFGRVLGIFK